MSTQSQDFWNFSMELYAKKGVADACLDLQDGFGIDVNLLLFCFWHGCHYGIFDQATLEQALEFSAIWKREVVQPLRNIRNWMKGRELEFNAGQSTQFNTLRERIKFDELAAEKYQQEPLELLAAKAAASSLTPTPPDAAIENVKCLLAAISVEMREPLTAKLAVISSAIEA